MREQNGIYGCTTRSHILCVIRCLIMLCICFCHETLIHKTFFSRTRNGIARQYINRVFITQPNQPDSRYRGTRKKKKEAEKTARVKNYKRKGVAPIYRTEDGGGAPLHFQQTLKNSGASERPQMKESNRKP